MHRVVVWVGFWVLGMALAGCSAPQTVDSKGWPRVESLPTSAPADLDKSAPATILRKGSDGHLYVVGGVSDTVQVGTVFLARFSGDWPLQDLPRPPLATGLVLRVFDDQSALVSIIYELPGVELAGLEVTWESEGVSEDVGKGIAYVTELAPNSEADVRFDLGEDAGVRLGDVYGLLRSNRAESPVDLQVANQLSNICVVNRVEEERATCRIWRGSSLLGETGMPETGDRMLFLEHTTGVPPRPGIIQIAKVQGDTDDALRAMLGAAMNGFLASLTAPNAEIEFLDSEFDATRDDFHRVEETLLATGGAQVLIAGTIVLKNKVPHLIINYSGVGVPSGPGMVAAPPDSGVDLGPVAELDVKKLQSVMAVVWSGMLVFRGQTSEGMMHLKSLLIDNRLQGPLRWHSRDQFAMRWAALNDLRQARWLVQQDMDVALAKKDTEAYLNALGTMVRLLDLLKLPDDAEASAAEYHQARLPSKPRPMYVSALGMYVEMLIGNNKISEAKAQYRELLETCPDGCGGDLPLMLMGAYWDFLNVDEAFGALVLEKIVSSGAKYGGKRLAMARMLQGVTALKNGELEEALVGLFESARLSEKDGNIVGVGRAYYFITIAQIARKEPAEALKAGVRALKIAEAQNAYSDQAEIYQRMAGIFLGESLEPGPYLGAAPDILTQSVSTQIALGDQGAAGEALFGMGSFLLRIGRYDEAQAAFQRAVLFSIRCARFDVAALAHLSLGVIAREQGHPEVFRDEIRRAKTMGEISDDPSVLESIQKVLSPPPPEPDDPTQLL